MRGELLQLSIAICKWTAWRRDLQLWWGEAHFPRASTALFDEGVDLRLERSESLLTIRYFQIEHLVR